MKERYETFTVLINRISRNIRKIKNFEMAEYNLRSLHISCLYCLYKEKGLSATELCERCEEDKAAISRSLDYLEKNGFLFCDSKAQKKYRSPLVLTEKGSEAGKQIADKIDDVLNEISYGLTDEERTEFYKSLTVISNSLDKLCRKYDK